MSSNLKSQRRNVIASQALAANTTLTSTAQKATYEKGMRVYVTITGAATTAGLDSILLCAVVPGTSTVIAITGVIGTSFLSTNGTWVVDFGPDAFLPASVAASQMLGAVAVVVPCDFAIRLTTAVGSSCTVKVDVELYP